MKIAILGTVVEWNPSARWSRVYDKRYGPKAGVRTTAYHLFTNSFPFSCTRDPGIMSRQWSNAPLGSHQRIQAACSILQPGDAAVETFSPDCCTHLNRVFGAEAERCLLSPFFFSRPRAPAQSAVVAEVMRTLILLEVNLSSRVKPAGSSVSAVVR